MTHRLLYMGSGFCTAIGAFGMAEAKYAAGSFLLLLGVLAYLCGHFLEFVYHHFSKPRPKG